ncbi:MAG TPA: ribosome small subunit-dependent GTPase A [Chitinophagaceae bacterium]
MEAVIYKSTGSWYVAKNKDGQAFNARIKGVFKIDEITSSNPIAVGDHVELEEEPGVGTWMITEIYERRNYVVRSSPHQKSKMHIVAANIDQSILFATLKEPRTSQGFIDRFLVSCEAFHVPAIIVFNKADIYRQKEMDRFGEMRDMYEKAGYRVFLTSVTLHQGIDELKAMLKQKITLVSGHSGVGKSSLMNAIYPQLGLKTQNVSGWSGKGQHTTTFAEMFDLPADSGGGKIIDTPGVKEFGIVDIPRQELSHYFPEMRERLNDCQFNNCLHVNEPGCAIKEAVANGEISMERYISYNNILDSIDEHSY